jgi:AraC family transcriptional regulator
MGLSQRITSTAPVPLSSVFADASAPGRWGLTDEPAAQERPAERPSRVVATRFRSMSAEACEITLPADEDHHVVGVVLRRTTLRLSASGRMIHDGIALPGLVHVSSPVDPVRCQYLGPHDALHIRIANALIAEATESLSDGAGPAFGAIGIVQDPIVESLAQALIASSDPDSPFGRLHDDCVGIAILTRIMASRARACPKRAAAATGLVKWRLNRTIEFIEASLSEPIGLPEMAGAAGLTRMHFAAQFRAATGLRPHEYLLRRRIERAQEMLLAPNAALVDVALEVGFQTQAHFTSVFRRFVGQPPHAWRQVQDRAA